MRLIKCNVSHKGSPGIMKRVYIVHGCHAGICNDLNVDINTKGVSACKDTLKRVFAL